MVSFAEISSNLLLNAEILEVKMLLCSWLSDIPVDGVLAAIHLYY